MPAKGFIKQMTTGSHKGRLHRALGVPEDKPIPHDKLMAALHSDRTFEGSSVAAMARAAKTMMGFKKK